MMRIGAFLQHSKRFFLIGIWVFMKSAIIWSKNVGGLQQKLSSPLVTSPLLLNKKIFLLFLPFFSPFIRLPMNFLLWPV